MFLLNGAFKYVKYIPLFFLNFFLPLEVGSGGFPDDLLVWTWNGPQLLPKVPQFLTMIHSWPVWFYRVSQKFGYTQSQGRRGGIRTFGTTCS